MTGNVFGLDRQVIGKGENITLYGDVRSENLKNLQVSLLDMSGRTVRRWMPSAFPVVLDGEILFEYTIIQAEKFVENKAVDKMIEQFTKNNEGSNKNVND